MKPFEELTRLGRIRRMRRLARSALQAFGLAGARYEFLRQAGNTLYKVYEADPPRADRPGLYASGKYMLRIHQPGYQTPEAIELELTWLASMVREAGLPVPEPVPMADGRLLASMSDPGIPGERSASLVRWLRGRELKREEIQPHHYRALGQLVARLHQHAARWQPPACPSKRKYDWEGLFGSVDENGAHAGEAWSLLPPEYVQPFEIVAGKTRQLMEQLGQGPEVYGLIHGDLGLEANVIFWKGDVRLIDFDDSGFGYYLYDLSIVLEDSQADQVQPRFREALLDGYTRLRPLSDDQLASLDLFLAAYAVFWSLYAVDVVRWHPSDREYLYQRMARYFRVVERFLSKN